MSSGLFNGDVSKDLIDTILANQPATSGMAGPIATGQAYAQQIAGGIPASQVIAPGVSYSPELPGGYTQADLNVVNLPRDVAPVFPDVPTTGEVFEPSYPTMPYAPTGTPEPEVFTPTTLPSPLTPVIPQITQPVIPQITEESLPNFFGQIPQFDPSQLDMFDFLGLEDLDLSGLPQITNGEKAVDPMQGEYIKPKTKVFGVPVEEQNQTMEKRPEGIQPLPILYPDETGLNKYTKDPRKLEYLQSQYDEYGSLLRGLSKTSDPAPEAIQKIKDYYAMFGRYDFGDDPIMGGLDGSGLDWIYQNLGLEEMPEQPYPSESIFGDSIRIVNSDGTITEIPTTPPSNIPQILPGQGTGSPEPATGAPGESVPQGPTELPFGITTPAITPATTPATAPILTPIPIPAPTPSPVPVIPPTIPMPTIAPAIPNLFANAPAPKPTFAIDDIVKPIRAGSSRFSLM